MFPPVSFVEQLTQLFRMLLKHFQQVGIPVPCLIIGSVDSHSCGICTVFVLINTDCAGLDLIVIKILVV